MLLLKTMFMWFGGFSDPKRVEREDMYQYLTVLRKVTDISNCGTYCFFIVLDPPPKTPETPVNIVFLWFLIRFGPCGFFAV